MRGGEEAATLALLDALQWQHVTTGLADRAGGLASRFLRSHPGVDIVDFVIAAGAELLQADLWTLNTKHFPILGDYLSEL